MSSIRIPSEIPESSEDSTSLHRAFDGLGCDAAQVIAILAHRSAKHLAELKRVYYDMFQEDLSQRLKAELHYNFEKAMRLWMRDPVERDAFILRDAMKSRASRRTAIFIETLCLRGANELQTVAEAYSSNFHRVLQDDIEACTEGPCRKLFVLHLYGNRDENADLNMDRAREEARDLYKAREMSLSLDEGTFTRILTTRNKRQLRSIFAAYKIMYGHDVHKGLKKRSGNSHGEFEELVRMVTKCVSNPARFFAKSLYRSMKGLGTDNDTLIRVVTTRAEIDMVDIKSEFLSKYKVSLDRMVASDTSGNYKQFLLAIMGVEH